MEPTCSYLPEYTMMVDNTDTTYGNATATNNHKNKGDFAHDVAKIALTQVGYLEKNKMKNENEVCSDEDLYSKEGEAAGNGNWTKYHKELGYTSGCAWCVIFVTWCAKEAGLDIGQKDSDSYDGLVIPSEPSVTQMRNYYEKIGRYYSSSTYTPQMGDIFFMQGNGNSHVGLVVSTDDTYVYAVHGNASGEDDTNDIQHVKYSRYKLSGTTITGYASPDYDSVSTNTHRYECTDTNHSASLEHTCTHCYKTATATMIAKHTHTTSTHSCSLCNYQATASMQIVHTASTATHSCPLCNYTDTGSVTLECDTAEHWYECSICYEDIARMKHIWILDNGIPVCNFCGSVKYIAINKIKLPICLTGS